MKALPPSRRTYDLLAIGELLIDFAPAGLNDIAYPIVSAYPGGAPANCLVAAHTLGLKTAFSGTVGQDSFGRRLKKTLADYGIDTTGIHHTDRAFTTLAMVTLDEDGDREFSFVNQPGADAFFTLTDTVKGLIRDSLILHFGSFSLVQAATAAEFEKALALAEEAGNWINFDPNYRASIWPDEATARTRILAGLDWADSVKIGLDELCFAYPEAGPVAVSDLTPRHPLVRQLFAGRKLQLAMITLGAEGSLLLARNQEGHLTAAFAAGFASEKTIDTTGAGDIFGGTAIGLLTRLARESADQGIPFYPGNLSKELLSKIAVQANLTASLSTEQHGGISSVPSEDRVKAALAALSN